MGQFISRTSRIFTTRYNIENRAHRAIEEHKKNPKPAPRHKKDAEFLQEMQSKHPELKEVEEKKDDALLDRLKSVRIESHGPPPEVKAAKRPLPERRSALEDEEFGFAEPAFIPPGKLTVRQSMEILSKNYVESKTYTAKDIAKDYKLNESDVENILKYFRPFNLYMPKDESERSLGIREKVSKVGLIGPAETKGND